MASDRRWLQGQSRLTGLTSCEMGVLRLLAVGSPSQRIADELVVTLDAVMKHVTPVLGEPACPTAPRRSPGPASSG